MYMCMWVFTDICVYVQLIRESTNSDRGRRTWRSLAVRVAMFAVGQLSILFVCKLHGFMVNYWVTKLALQLCPPPPRDPRHARVWLCTAVTKTLNRQPCYALNEFDDVFVFSRGWGWGGDGVGQKYN